VVSPKNIIARKGTPLSELIEFCGGTSEEVGKVICGGPMMVFALPLWKQQLKGPWWISSIK
jgi:electron transport complex protein RnfC